jgi:hypothetical protein
MKTMLVMMMTVVLSGSLTLAADCASGGCGAAKKVAAKSAEGCKCDSSKCTAEKKDPACTCEKCGCGKKTEAASCCKKVEATK